MDFQSLLVALMSENNDIRAQAEKSLNDDWLQAHSDQTLIELARQMRVADSEIV
jgi:hypothetical protein